MNPEHLAAVRALFDEVVDLPDAEREARLRSLTKDDELIHHALAFCRSADGGSVPDITPFLSSVMQSAAAPSLKPGDTLGAWRIVDMIGQGGMGAVFRARRSDGHFEQEAAVKLLHGIPSAKSLQYLAQERQILATLSHPNIARLYDGGATPGGHPYLVMEHVEGVTIDRYCRDHRLPVRDVLKLMIDICGAIGFAHQRLIVHCDIKPSNILVTQAGRPVLLDFGIARLLDGDATNEIAAGAANSSADPGAAAPRTLARAFTPQYASPEQMNGEPLTTATDVFGLGRLLRELLEAARSTVTARSGANDRAAPTLDRELLALIDKATQPDPAKRYASAGALAADIGRYLERRPLEAVDAAPAYVAGKFVQRNWPWLAAAAVFTLTVGLAAQRIVSERDRSQLAEQQALKERDATTLARADALRERDAAEAARAEAERERDRTAQAEKRALQERDSARRSEERALAERNRATAAQRSSAQHSAFLLSIFENEELADTDSPDIPAVRIVDAAAARVERELAEQPETQASIHRALGIIYANLGRPRQAIDAFERAIVLERKLDRPLDLAEVLSRVATLRSSGAEAALAEKYAREALALRLRHAGADAAAVSDTQVNLGILLARLSRWDESRTLLLAAIDARERLHGRETLQFAEANLALGRHYNLQPASTREALPYLETALGIYNRLQGESSRGAMTTLAARAFALRKLGRYDESVTDHRRAVELRRKAHGESSMHVAGAMQGLGTTLAEIGRPVEAAATLREAVALRKKNQPTPSTLLATNLMRLAEAGMASGDMAGAETAFAEAVAILRKTLPAGDTLVARALYLQGQFLVRSGRAAEAGAQLTESYGIWRKLFGENGGDTINVKLAMVERDLAQGDLRAATERMATLAKDADRPATRVGYLRHRGLVAARTGNLDAALADLVEAEERQRKAGGDHDLRAWRIALDRARVLADAGRRAEAAALAERVAAKLMPQLVPEATERVELRRLQQP
jgi:tetratricopeptide (TPR) repeat protein